jgi:hypothetical protein
MAQGAFPYATINHSSVDSNGNLNLRWQDFTGGMSGSELLYNTAGGAWNNATVSNYDELSLQAEVPYTFGQRLRFRLRYLLESPESDICIMNPAYSDADTFPPTISSMAYINSDASGDSMTVYSPNLDLLDSYVAMGPQKLVFSQSNLSGTFPTMVSVTSYNIYMGIITNMEAVSDSVVFAMIYSFNIPGLLSNGLYKVTYDSETNIPSFSRIGDILSQVSDGYLHMACTFTDLTSDPDFGAWPNETNGIMVVGATMSVSVTLPSFEPSIGFGDYATPALLILTDNVYQVNANTLPSVSVSSYNPNSKTLVLDYNDAEQDFPLVAEVQTQNGTIVQGMAMSGDFSQTVQYIMQLPMEENGILTWRFSDNGFQFTTAEYNPSPNQDQHLVPVPITCVMQNPVRNWPLNLSIKGLSPQPTQVQVFNLKGQKLGELPVASTLNSELNLSWDGKLQGHKLAKGVYFLKVQNASHTLNTKFVIVD